MSTSFLSSPTAKPIREASGDSFEALKVLLEQALSMSDRLRSKHFELYDARKLVNGAIAAVNVAEQAASQKINFEMNPETSQPEPGGGYGLPGKQSAAAPWVRGKLGHRGV